MLRSRNNAKKNKGNDELENKENEPNKVNIVKNKKKISQAKNENKISQVKNKNKIYQALSLPVLCNMNPRSVYNK